MESLLTTKLTIPPARPQLVQRPRLVERLNQGLYHRLALISAPAGSGKTTLVTEWLSSLQQQTDINNPGHKNTGWLSLEEADNDPFRFITYFIAALKQMALIDEAIERRCLSMLQPAAQPDWTAMMALLAGETTNKGTAAVLVLDDYHLIENRDILDAVNFYLEHIPPGMQLVIVTREDPDMPLSRLRANDRLSEVRAADLRFTPEESVIFFKHVMKLELSENDIIELDNRTEGWAAGLQLAAISMQGQANPADFIRSFTGSHHFVMDYLMEEVLQQQPESIQTFLLRTSCLPRLCGSLCDAVLHSSEGSGQRTLEYLENTNLFLVPLDNERHWYRYHHLFSQLLRQRFLSSNDGNRDSEAELQRRASEWYEKNGDDLHAFQHAVAANDIDRAARLLHGKGMPLHFRGAITPVLNWLESLPASILDSKPSLWVMYASALSMAGRFDEVEEKLQAAESILRKTEPDENSRNLAGHIAAIRALLAAAHDRVETIIQQSNLALELLHPDNLPVRTATTWKLGIAYQLQGDRNSAARAFQQAIAICQKSGNTIIDISASSGLGNIQESQNRLKEATATYRHVLEMVGKPYSPAACEALYGLARIHYQWNDLENALQYLLQCLSLSRPSETTFRPAIYKIFVARVKLATGYDDEASTILAEIEQYANRYGFIHQMPELGSTWVRLLLKQGNLQDAAQKADRYKLPLEQARISLADGKAAAAQKLLVDLRNQAETNDWQDELLKASVLQSLTFHMQGETEKAFAALDEALSLAHPGEMVRIFIDEGEAMSRLLNEAVTHHPMKPAFAEYVAELLAAFSSERADAATLINHQQDESLIDPLSTRELEILRLIASGLSNHDISKQLFLALSTVKGHNKRIFNKLQAKNRTEAVANARQAGLL